MAEVTQHNHCSWEDQLKVIASCSLMFLSKGENRERFVFPNPQRRELFCQWQAMGLTGFLSSTAQQYSSLNVLKLFYISYTLF